MLQRALLCGGALISVQARLELRHRNLESLLDLTEDAGAGPWRVSPIGGLQ